MSNPRPNTPATNNSSIFIHTKKKTKCQNRTSMFNTCSFLKLPFFSFKLVSQFISVTWFTCFLHYKYKCKGIHFFLHSLSFLNRFSFQSVAKKTRARNSNSIIIEVFLLRVSISRNLVCRNGHAESESDILEQIFLSAGHFTTENKMKLIGWVLFVYLFISVQWSDLHNKYEW